MYELIMKKKNGEELSGEEIYAMIEGYESGKIPDYQISAMLMAICFQGMTKQETTDLTMSMVHSGDVVDLSPIEGVKVDKHSTGGVGDKTTLVIGPIVASCGVKMAKMSGRGLGHTGGTIDKLESIPGMRTNLSQEDFFSIVNKVGISVVGQHGNLVPADKKLYALRDVTGTVDSIPLIASSIMSKKLAAGSDCILLDVKTGSGAFMKNLEDSIELAREMVVIGEQAGKKIMAIITGMDMPLGSAIGNSLEVMEAIDTLQGRGPEDFTEICVTLASHLLQLAGKGDIQDCEKMVKKVISNGSAYQKCIEMVEAQGGDISVMKDYKLFPKTAYKYDVKAKKEGYIFHMNAEQCGIASMVLGAGRETKESKIDHAAGIILNKKTGDYVEKGEVLASLYSSSFDRIQRAEEILNQSYTFSRESVKKSPLILAKVDSLKVEQY